MVSKKAELKIPGTVTLYPEIICDRLVIKPSETWEMITESDIGLVQRIGAEFDGIKLNNVTIENAVTTINKTNKYKATIEELKDSNTWTSFKVLVVEPITVTSTSIDFKLLQETTLYPAYMGIDTGKTIGIHPIGYTGVFASPIKVTFKKKVGERYQVVVSSNVTLASNAHIFDGHNTVLYSVILNGVTNGMKEVGQYIAEKLLPNEISYKVTNNKAVLTNISKYSGYTVDIICLDKKDIPTVIKGYHFARTDDPATLGRQSIAFFKSNKPIDTVTLEENQNIIVTLSPNIKVNQMVLQFDNMYGNGSIKINDTTVDFSFYNIDEFKRFIDNIPELTLEKTDNDHTFIIKLKDTITSKKFNEFMLITANDWFTTVLTNKFDNIVDGVDSKYSLIYGLFRFNSVTFDSTVKERPFTNSLEINIDGKSTGFKLRGWEINSANIYNRIVPTLGTLGINALVTGTTGKPVGSVTVNPYMLNTSNKVVVDFIYNGKPVDTKNMFTLNTSNNTADVLFPVSTRITFNG